MMLDLRQYYLDNITEDDVYYKFYQLVETIDIWYSCGLPVPKVKRRKVSFAIRNTDEAINKFREFCQPERKFENDEEKCWFYIVSYYLKMQGYYIEQFPNVLNSPPDSPIKFTNIEIRNWANAHKLDNGGIIRYSTRRKIVADLKFKRAMEFIEPGNSLKALFNKISTNDISFQQKNIDEKIREIANLIENLLKENKKFLALDYDEIAFGYITNESIKKFRRQIQCFRHATEETLMERKQFTDNQKGFLVDYGTVILKVIYKLKSNKEKKK